MTGLRIGISPFGHTRAGAMEVADAAVAGGIDSLWLGDGLLVVDMFPMWSGGIEPFSELSFLAGRHRGVRVAVGAAVLPLRDPLYVAKQAATLDQLTEGNFVLGLTPGIWERESAYRGLDHRRRARRFDDFAGAVRAAFVGAPYESESVTLPAEGRLSPVPFTEGGPPIWYGGGPGTFTRALRDGVPFQARGASREELAAQTTEWFDRGGGTFAVRVGFALATDADHQGTVVRGPAAYLAEELDFYRSIGITDVSLIPGNDDATSLAFVDTLVTEVLPQLV
jgi:alkanesulfonate monooxygenase SsuD/methylene tetrahydromethanopterin reductase-like flavin-dependent oxidoreductase (luciferase family)